MMKLQVNLSSRPFANYTLYHLGFVVIGLAGLLLLAHNAFWFISNHGDVQQMEREIAALQTEVENNILEARALGDEIDQVQRNRRFREVCAFVDGRIRQRRFSWIRMLNLLQDAIPANVKIESITPRVEQESIRITLACVARKDEAVNEFIENLEGIREFDRVSITSEDKEGGTTSFPLTLEYSPFGFHDGGGRSTAGKPPAEPVAGESAGGTDSGTSPERGDLIEMDDLAEFPDPEIPEFDPFAIEDGDLFTDEGGDLFGGGDENPFGAGNDIFGEPGSLSGDSAVVPVPVTGTDPDTKTESRKRRGAGDLIRKPPLKTGEKKNRVRHPGGRPGGRS